MKTTCKLIILVLIFLALAANTYAQSPREQLQQMVEQLQKNPTDNALREKIIKLAPTLKPSPALPDAAVSYEGRAQFAFRSAKSEGDFLAAAQEYEKAVAAAPWVPGYYSDLCTIYEKAGKYEDAKRNCGFFLIGLSDPAQMTDVKRRIAGLEFGIEKANSPPIEAKKENEGRQTQLQKRRSGPEALVGTWYFYAENNKKSEWWHVRFELRGGEIIEYLVWNRDFEGESKGFEREESHLTLQGKRLNGTTLIWAKRPCRYEGDVNDAFDEIRINRICHTKALDAFGQILRRN